MLRREFIIALSATAAAWPLAVRAQEPKHRIYHAPANLFAEQYTDYNFGPIRIAMGQLIDRYGIRNKRVLALGAGSCFEEQYFVELGNNQLTVVDIDENKSAEYALKLADPGPMGYIIGDALDFDPDEYNVFYASGFTPDEMRRYAMVAPEGRMPRFWRLEWDPFHPAFMRYANKLSPGGLFIVQSIAYSIDALAHKQYLPACHRQLAASGLRMLELWRFKTSTGVMLYVAQKDGGEKPPMQTPLLTFHGQADLREPIERIYP